MKKHSFSLDSYQVSLFEKPIRSQKDIIEFLMNSIKIMLAKYEVDESKKNGSMTLVVDKMSRLFVGLPNKIVSIHFPFKVVEHDDGIIFKNNFIDDIDSRITSEVLSLVKKTDIFNSQCLYKFVEAIDTSSNIYGENFWSFIQGLLLFESGYLRYDYDEIHENGSYHPLNHYDIFFSSNATFKIGINEKASELSMIDLLDINTKCHYVDFPSV